MVTDFNQFRQLIARECEITPSSPQEVKSLEESLRIQLPTAYSEYLLTFGSLSAGNITVLGIVATSKSAFTVISAVELLRAIDPDLPNWLIPVLFIDTNNILCLKCDPDLKDYNRGPLIMLDIDDMPMNYKSLDISGYFDEDIYNRVFEEHFRHKALNQLEKRVKEFNQKHQYDHAKGGHLPRNHEWRPYRYCIQDVLFGSVVIRHNRDGNYLQVDVFLPVAISGYEADAGAEALTVFLLSESYKCGGTMEIKFTENVEGGNVPASIKRVAERYKIKITGRDHITPLQARKLFAAMTGFSSDLRGILSSLQEAGRLSIEKACYAIHHGIWSKPEVETIILGSLYPDSVLGGDAAPERRHIYLQDLQDACGALLGGALDRGLAMRERQDTLGVTYDLEDDIRHLEINFDPDYYAKTYMSSEDLPVPWLVGSEDGSKVIAANTPIQVLIRARDAANMQIHLGADFIVARQCQLKSETDAGDCPVFILVPSDFYELGRTADEFLSIANEYQIGILVCPESMLVFIEEATRRLSSGRITRND